MPAGACCATLFFCGTGAAATGRFFLTLFLHGSCSSTFRTFFRFASAFLGSTTFLTFEYSHFVLPVFIFLRFWGIDPQLHTLLYAKYKVISVSANLKESAFVRKIIMQNDFDNHLVFFLAGKIVADCIHGDLCL